MSGSSQNTNTAPRRPDLIDRGFDTPFSAERLERLCGCMGDEEQLQALVDEFHEEDHAIDMKRGEFYPEILRGIAGLKDAAAKAYGVTTAQVHPNFGSNGNIDTILTAIKLAEVKNGIGVPIVENGVVLPNKTATLGGVLMVSPTYFRNYNSCESKQLRLILVPLRTSDWQINTDAFIDRTARDKPSAVWLVTPNNPTGIPIPDQDLLRIIEATPDDTAIVIDRTLVNIRPEIETVALLKKFSSKRLVVLHSFSKYAAMSHLRVGIALYSQIGFADEVKGLLPLGLGVEGAIKAARLLAVGPLRPSESVCRNIAESRAALQSFCSKHPSFRMTDFVANYVMLEVPPGMDSAWVVNELRVRGVIAMGGEDFPQDRRPGMLRLHAGGPPQYMLRTVEALSAIADVNK